MLRSLFTTGIFFFHCLYLPAQQLSFNIYTPADGLTDARVQKIFQDSRGILYFLTRDGFSSFDGQRFENYTAVNNKPLSIVNDIIEEQDGTLLVAALSGIYRLQGHRLWKDSLLSARLPEPGQLLPAGKNQWVILSGNGSMLYRQRSLQPLQAGNNNTRTVPLIFDKAISNGHWIIGTQPVPGNKSFTTVFYNLADHSFRSSGPVAVQPLLLSTGNQLFIKQNGEWKHFIPADPQSEISMLAPPSFEIAPQVINFFIDRQQNKWIFSNDNTLTLVTNAGNKKTVYNTSNGLPENITGMYQDRENNYWLMVAGKGVYKMVQSGIRQWDFYTSPILSLSSTANSVCIRSENKISILEAASLQERALPVRLGLMQVAFTGNQCLAFYNNGQLETEDGTIITFAAFAEGSKQISSRITEDNNGRLLTAGDFISVIENNNIVATTPLPYFTDNIAAGDDNLYWCFARNGTVSAYELTAGLLKPVVSYTDNDFSTRCALHWNKDSFYIGTRNNGIILVKASLNGYSKIGTISTADGLSNNFVTGLLKVNGNQLLVSTVTGLDKVHLSVAGNSAEQLFSRIGLFTGVREMARLSDTLAIALTDEGKLYEIQTASLQTAGINPSLFFHSILVNGIEIDTTGKTSFPYNKNNFQFRVSAPGFVDEKNTRFIFRINGEVVNTGAASRSGEVSFSNLRPGRYTVEVTAIFPGNAAMHKTISYTFRINKPFWKTTAFIAAFTAFILLLIYSIFRIQLRRKLQRRQVELEKEKAIARERSRIASDMHDDLGAGISTIKYLSQSAPFISTDIQKENNLKIAAQADELVDKMNDIIWAMNETNDTLDNLLYYTKAWVAGFAQQHNMDAVISIPSAIPSTVIRGEKRQHIFLVIKEAVHNIIKHAKATQLRFSLELKDGLLVAAIHDNGIGFDVARARAGNGLSNMEKRIKTVNGTLEMQSGEGTTIRFSVPV